MRFAFVFSLLCLLSTLRELTVSWKVQPGQIVRVIFRAEKLLKELQVEMIDLDFSAGTVALSSPPDELPLSAYLSNDMNVSSDQTPSAAVLYLQMGKRAIKRVPDGALLGMLVLISTELLQREVSTKSPMLPPLVRDLANSTLEELDQKLELLSRLEWRVDPFIQSELGSLRIQPIDAFERYISSEILPWVDIEGSSFLSRFVSDPEQVKALVQSMKDIIKLILLSTQNDANTVDTGFQRREWERVLRSIGSVLLKTIQSQPIEAIDRFLLNDVLPQIDIQLSPLLSNLIADPAQVNVVVKNIKDLVKLGTNAITIKVDNPGNNILEPAQKGTMTLTDRILEQVDNMGKKTEDAVYEWNRIVGDFGKSVKVESVRDLLPHNVFLAWRKTRDSSKNATSLTQLTTFGSKNYLSEGLDSTDPLGKDNSRISK